MSGKEGLDLTLKGRKTGAGYVHGRVCHPLTLCLHAHNNQVSAPILKGVQTDVIYTTANRV